VGRADFQPRVAAEIAAVTGGASAAVLERARIWARENGLQAILHASMTVVEDPSGASDFHLAWKALERNGGRSSVSVGISGNLVTTSRAFAQWSDLPTPESDVLVVPDILTFLRWSDAISHRDVAPFVLVAPGDRHAVPPEWHDADYWRFASVTVLADDVLDPSAAMLALSVLGDDHIGVAPPPLGLTWSAWGANCELGAESFQAILDRSSRARSFQRIVQHNAAQDFRSCTKRDLDACNRLCRMVPVEDGEDIDGYRQIVVRSDRTCAPVLALTSRAGTQTRYRRDMQNVAWTEKSVDGFLRGESVVGQGLGDRISEQLRPHFGADLASLRRLAAFIALTYVYQALDELPLIVVRGGAPFSRLAMRRTAASLCFSSTVTARVRAAQLARIADAAPGTLILDEPGALCGPGGSTEIGRFLENGLVRDASAYTSMSGASALRPLDVFGPKLVFSSTACASGLGCTVYDVEISGVPEPSAPMPAAVLAGLRDMLNVWAMDAVSRLRDHLGPQAPASSVLPALLADLFHNRDGDLVTSPPARAPGPYSSQAKPSPERRMERMLEGCAGRDWLSMVQVMLEIALIAGDDQTYSPERVGRWLAARPEIDGSIATERRRLYGQISRIYPLRIDQGASRAEAASGFDFCLSRVCSDCPYQNVCDATFPGMRKLKNKSSARSRGG
jgi:hypothetical protein